MGAIGAGDCRWWVVAFVMPVRAIEEHGVEETLDAIDRCYLVRTEADSVMIELAARFADLQPGEGLPRRESDPVLRGMERSVRVGGAGTPRIAESMVAELGDRMRVGSWSARAFVADALDVRHRLPLIWARVRAREARIRNVRLVAARTRHLSVAAAGFADAAMVESVDGSLPWGRFEARLMGKIVAADPATAAGRPSRWAGSSPSGPGPRRKAQPGSMSGPRWGCAVVRLRLVGVAAAADLEPAPFRSRTWSTARVGWCGGPVRGR